MPRVRLIAVAFALVACSSKPPAAPPQETVYVSQNNQPGALGVMPGAPPQQGYPQQGYPQQGYPQQGYPQQSPLPPPLTPPVGSARNDNAAQDPSRPPSGKVPNAGKVLGEVSKAFEDCYKEGLKANPDEEGSVKLTASVGLSGEVTNVAVSELKGLSQSVVDCASDKLKKAKFEPPQGGLATLVVPLTFTTKKPAGK